MGFHQKKKKKRDNNRKMPMQNEELKPLNTHTQRQRQIADKNQPLNVGKVFLWLGFEWDDGKNAHICLHKFCAPFIVLHHVLGCIVYMSNFPKAKVLFLFASDTYRIRQTCTQRTKRFLARNKLIECPTANAVTLKCSIEMSAVMMTALLATGCQIMMQNVCSKRPKWIFR